MNGNHVGFVVILLIIIAGGWYLFSGTTAKAPTTTPSDNSITTSTTIAEDATSTPPVQTNVTYTDQGFSPKSVTVSLGTPVKFINESSGKMWVASAVHPSHTEYSGTSLGQHCPDTTNSSFDECASVTAGESFVFIFNKVGTWKYHNHVNSSQTGTVIVVSPDAMPIPESI